MLDLFRNRTGKILRGAAFSVERRVSIDYWVRVRYYSVSSLLMTF